MSSQVPEELGFLAVQQTRDLIFEIPKEEAGFGLEGGSVSGLGPAWHSVEMKTGSTGWLHVRHQPQPDAFVCKERKSIKEDQPPLPTLPAPTPDGV